MSPPVLLYASIIAMFWAVPAESGSVDEITGNPLYDLLVSFGPIGVVFVLGLTGHIWFKKPVDGIIADKMLLQEQVTKFTTDFDKTVIPALLNAATAITQATQATQAQNERVAGLESVIRDLTGQVGDLTSQIDGLKTQVAELRGGNP